MENESHPMFYMEYNYLSIPLHQSWLNYPLNVRAWVSAYIPLHHVDAIANPSYNMDADLLTLC